MYGSVPIERVSELLDLLLVKGTGKEEEAWVRRTINLCRFEFRDQQRFQDAGEPTAVLGFGAGRQACLHIEMNLETRINHHNVSLLFASCAARVALRHVLACFELAVGYCVGAELAELSLLS